MLQLQPVRHFGFGECLLPLAEHALGSRRGAFDPRSCRLAAIEIITGPRVGMSIGMSWNVMYEKSIGVANECLLLTYV